MKVNNSTTGSIASSEAQNASRAKAADRKTTLASDKDATIIEGSTKTEISARGKEIANAKAAASSAPDVREQKIAELRKRIQEGKYKVDANAVADKLVDEHMETAGIGGA